MEFDRIYAEVDLGRIEENMEAMKEHLRPGTKMYGVCYIPCVPLSLARFRR